MKVKPAQMNRQTRSRGLRKEASNPSFYLDGTWAVCKDSVCVRTRYLPDKDELELSGPVRARFLGEVPDPSRPRSLKSRLLSSLCGGFAGFIGAASLGACLEFAMEFLDAVGGPMLQTSGAPSGLMLGAGIVGAAALGIACLGKSHETMDYKLEGELSAGPGHTTQFLPDGAKEAVVLPDELSDPVAFLP